MKNSRPRKKIKRAPAQKVQVHLPADYGWRVLGTLAEDLSHLLTDEDKIRVAGIVRNRDYEGYTALSKDWGPQGISSCDSAALATTRARYQVAALLKKFRFSSNDAERKQAAIDKFVAAELACKAYNREGWKAFAFNEDDRMCGVYTYARAFLEKVLGLFLPSESELTLWSRHGPGANLDTKEGRVNAYFKYSEWPYSCTKGAARIARSAIAADERWLGALEDDYRSRMEIPKTAILNQERFWSDVMTVVPGNRVAFVPKDARTERSIAIEPSLNLYLQLGVDGYIRRRLKRWGIDIDSQEKNQELARRGSRDWESPENFVTLDLAAASDSISTAVCRTLLPLEWYDYLMKLRSPQGELDGTLFHYEKISSMGNGFTFALETAIFASLIYGVQREFQGSYDRNACAVFGDDLIVASSIAEPLVEALNLAGFSVNPEKSFTKGPFRESCGADWFKGRPVRPVFFESQPTSVMELWTDINRLKRTLSLRFMVEESKTEELMVKWIPVEHRGLTGPCSDEVFDSWLHSHKPTKNGSYKEWIWKWERLFVKTRPKRVKSFLFRKLMNTLRDGPNPEPVYLQRTRHNTWRGIKVSAVGGCFAVTVPHAVTVGKTFSTADVWQYEYEETTPVWSE